MHAATHAAAAPAIAAAKCRTVLPLVKVTASTGPRANSARSALGGALGHDGAVRLDHLDPRPRAARAPVPRRRARRPRRPPARRLPRDTARGQLAGERLRLLAGRDQVGLDRPERAAPRRSPAPPRPPATARGAASPPLGHQPPPRSRWSAPARRARRARRPSRSRPSAAAIRRRSTSATGLDEGHPHHGGPGLLEKAGQPVRLVQAAGDHDAAALQRGGRAHRRAAATRSTSSSGARRVAAELDAAHRAVDAERGARAPARRPRAAPTPPAGAGSRRPARAAAPARCAPPGRWRRRSTAATPRAGRGAASPPRARSPPGPARARSCAGRAARRCARDSPSRSSPATARSRASTSPASSLRRRVSTLPRMGTQRSPGRRSASSAARRALLLPTVAPSGERVEPAAVAGDHGVAGVGAGQHRGHAEPGGELGGQVLGGVDRHVGAAVEKRALDRGGEPALALELLDRGAPGCGRPRCGR